MKSASKNRTALLTIDAIILMLCIFGVYRLTLKAYLPFDVISENSYIVISRIYQEQSHLAAGDTVISIDGHKFSNWEEIELYTDAKNIGNKVNVNYLINGRTAVAGITLTQYYSSFEIIIISFVGLLFIFLAIFVALKSDDKSALIFHWASIGLTMIITMTSGNYSVEPNIFSLTNHCLFLFAFTLTPVLFIHFTCTFTSFSSAIIKKIIITFYLFAALLAGYLCLLYFDAIQQESISSIHRYVEIYSYVFRPFLLLSVIVALLIFYKAYRRADDLVTKRKLNWLLFGFLIGPSAFILFWVLPIIFLDYSLMTEAIMHLLLISVPVTFAIAIVKYRLMDIDLILRRSVVYSVALGGIIITYIILFTLITELVKGINETIPAVIATVLVAFLLQPAKNRVQKFVDRKFFRVEYNYREEQKRFLEEIKNANDIKSLANKIVKHADALIPVSKIGFFIIRQPENRVSILAHKGFEILIGRSLKFDEENLKTDLSIPVALDDEVEPGVVIESADLNVFKRWGMVLVFPIKSPSGVIHAFLVLGTKKSGARYYQEDIDLLNTVASTSALTIDRIKLQEELIIERLEAERLAELNKMKSKFASTVTHELKTPLTGIKNMGELLQLKGECLSKESQEYLRIIDGESDKLGRLINNILDFTKIEEGIQRYKKTLIEFNQLVRDALKIMKYQFKMSKIDLVKNISNEEYVINADGGAIKEAMINILSNSIKYSEKKSTVTVSTFTNNRYVCIKIEDEGYGISETELDDIFKPFYRAKDTRAVKTEGTGLGLAIVKDILDSHQGKISVESIIGKGSTFTLQFPNESSNKT